MPQMPDYMAECDRCGLFSDAEAIAFRDGLCLTCVTEDRWEDEEWERQYAADEAAFAMEHSA
jgi:hypothetical protein